MDILEKMVHHKMLVSAVGELWAIHQLLKSTFLFLVVFPIFGYSYSLVWPAKTIPPLFVCCAEVYMQGKGYSNPC